MNFIAHYYLDHGNPESFFALGAATPDLLSIYNPTHRIKRNHLPDFNLINNPEYIFFYKGLIRHFEADALFHSSKFFSDETHFLSAAFSKQLPDLVIPRKFFLAHILFELILDRVIIKDHPKIIMDYYHHYDNTSMRELKLATEFMAGHSLPNYEHFLNKFKENRYLLHYLEWDHIGFVTMRIMKRVGILEAKFLANPRFFEFLATYENRLLGLYPQVFIEMALKSAQKT